MHVTKTNSRPHETKKIPSRSELPGPNLKQISVMMKRLTLPILALCGLFLTAGCLHSGKNAKPKENQAIAAELEESFRQRWIEKRAGELTVRGMTADLARAQAIEEFKVKYNFPAPTAR